MTHMGTGYVFFTMRFSKGFPLFQCLSSFMTRHITGKVVVGSLPTVATVDARQCWTDPLRPPLPTPNVFIKLNESDGSTYPYIITQELEEMITQGDARKKLKLLEVLMLLYLKREQGQVLPEEISVKEFTELLSLSEEDQHYLLNLIMGRRGKTRPKDGWKGNVKEISRHEILEKNDSCIDNSYLKYSSSNNTMFSSASLLKSDRSRYYNTILSQGLLFGQKIVFDCAYERYMSYAQLRETANDLNRCVRINRRSRRPFGLYFCNVEDGCSLNHHLQRVNPAFGYDLPVHIHSSSYLDLFYSGDIVYLSPYVKRELEYHPDDVYVIGALANNDSKLSVKRALKDGVRCAKLPLGFYQLLKQSSVLSIKETFTTLLSKKNSGVWSHARKLDKDLTFH